MVHSNQQTLLLCKNVGPLFLTAFKITKSCAYDQPNWTYTLGT